jgi:hypothetical protein
MKIVINIFIIVSLLTSCSVEGNSQDKFYDIEKLNSEIERDLGLNILKIKKRTDSVYSNDKEFYINLIESRLVSDTVDYFQKAGIPVDPINSDGVYLNRIDSRDSVARIMMVYLAKNINLNECNSKMNDTLCDFKIELQKNLMEHDPRKYMMIYIYFHGTLAVMRDRNYLTTDEFNYLILYFHYLGMLTTIE